MELKESDVESARYRVVSKLRADPLKWTGIAAAAGFILGLTGRIARRRAKKVNATFFPMEGC